VPADGIELRQAMEAALVRNGPTYIRICRNATPVLFAGKEPLEIGRIRKIRDGGDLTIAVCGVPTFMAIEASERLAAEGTSVDLLEVSSIKPIDARALEESARKTGRVLTVEEHTVNGGMGSAVAEVLGSSAPVPVQRIGIEDRFAESGDYMPLLAKNGISTDRILERARAMIAAKDVRNQ
jgi:transketolase